MEPFIGQIMLFAGNFAPRGWAKCDGQLLSIAENSALFSILGTTYGGDGRTTFGLPDLRGRVPMHEGSGPGLTPRSLGARLGSETNTLTVANLPAHAHTVDVEADAAPGTTTTPDAGTMPAESNEDIYGDGADPVVTTTRTTSSVGSSTPVNNVQPVQVLNYCIALVGIFPSRS